MSGVRLSLDQYPWCGLEEGRSHRPGLSRPGSISPGKAAGSQDAAHGAGRAAIAVAGQLGSVRPGRSCPRSGGSGRRRPGRRAWTRAAADRGPHRAGPRCRALAGRPSQCGGGWPRPPAWPVRRPPPLGRRLLERPGRHQARREKVMERGESLYARWGALAVFVTRRSSRARRRCRRTGSPCGTCWTRSRGRYRWQPAPTVRAGSPPAITPRTTLPSWSSGSAPERW